MKVIEVKRDEIPQDWTEEHVRVLEHGHERGVLAKTANGRSKVADNVLGFASNRGVGVTVFGGLTFVDVSAGGDGGPRRFKVAG